ncbi:MAG: hypothetical protein AAFP02_11735 [Bacteroidota bacterium]
MASAKAELLKKAFREAGIPLKKPMHSLHKAITSGSELVKDYIFIMPIVCGKPDTDSKMDSFATTLFVSCHKKKNYGLGRLKACR